MTTRKIFILITRLKDEKQVAAIIDKVQEYLERQGTVSELCRVYLRKIQHLYYKFDANVLKQKEVRNYEILCEIFYFVIFITLSLFSLG
jgi:isochorismate synthase EntC